jgi:hypothetical protein
MTPVKVVPRELDAPSLVRPACGGLVNDRRETNQGENPDSSVPPYSDCVLRNESGHANTHSVSDDLT